MKVRFYVLQEESDVYDFPDDTSLAELENEAFDWMNNNVAPYYEMAEDDDE